MNIGSLIITLGANTQGLIKAEQRMKQFEVSATKNIGVVNAALVSSGQHMETFGKNATRYMTLPLALVGGASFKMYQDFDASMNKIVGLVGVAQSQVDAWRSDVLKMGPALGQAPKALADSLFFITSAGIKGAAAMDVLEMSAKASASGLGETKVVADLVTSAMNAYGIANLTAANAADILTATVREGKAEPAELAASMGMVLPIASQMGVTFNEVGASIASMTRTGTNASTASMQLRQILASLYKPTTMAEEALNKMNTSSSELKKTIADKGLLTALMDINELTKIYGEEVAGTVFPNIRALSGVLDLMGKNVEGNIAIFESLNNATGSLDKAFQSATNTVAFKWKQAISQGQTTLTILGKTVSEAFLPILQNMIDRLGQATAWFSSLDDSTKRIIVTIGGFLIAVGPVSKILGFLVGNIFPKMLNLLPNIISLIRTLTLVIAANPVGAFAVGVLAAAAAIYAFTENTNRLTIAQQTLNSVNKTASLAVTEEKTKLEGLMRLANSEFATKEDKRRAILEINKISPAYLGFIDEEAIKTGQATTAVNAYIASLQKKAEVQAAEQMLVDLEKRRITDIMEGNNRQIGTWDQLKIRLTGMVWWTKAAEMADKARNESAINYTDEYIKKKKTLEAITQGEYQKGKDFILQATSIAASMQKISIANTNQAQAIKTRIETQRTLEVQYTTTLKKELANRLAADKTLGDLQVRLKQANQNNEHESFRQALGRQIKERQQTIAQDLQLDYEANQQRIRQYDDYLKTVNDRQKNINNQPTTTTSTTPQGAVSMFTVNQQAIIDEMTNRIKVLNDTSKAYGDTSKTNSDIADLYGQTISALLAEGMDPMSTTIQNLVSAQSILNQVVKDSENPMKTMASELERIDGLEKLLGSSVETTSARLSIYSKTLDEAAKAGVLSADQVSKFKKEIQELQNTLAQTDIGEQLGWINEKSNLLGGTFNTASAELDVYTNEWKRLYDTGQVGTEYYNSIINKVQTLTAELDRNRTIAQEIREPYENMASTLSSTSSLFGSLAGMADESTASILNWIGGVLDAVSQLIAMLGQYAAAKAAQLAIDQQQTAQMGIDTAVTGANTAVKLTNASASLGLTAAKSGEAVSSATASGAKMPFPLNIMAIAAGVAAVLSALASIPKAKAKMKFGGMVPPGFPNDTFDAALTSNEAVIPLDNPRVLEKLNGGSKQTSRYRFSISGHNLEALAEEQRKYDDSY